MKKSIAILSLVLGLGTSVFAAPKPKADESVKFTALKSDQGFGVKVGGEKSVVIFYDAAGNVIYKDQVSKGLPAEKGYIVTGLENGDYTVEVKTENGSASKKMHVYDDGQAKSYLFIQ
ncbi:MAG TPA: hypothetical protein VHE59_12260 [Mucilaginibacter sp.]|nr:hypothetical protein [Mucilaginibacter sp.]